MRGAADSSVVNGVARWRETNLVVSSSSVTWPTAGDGSVVVVPFVHRGDVSDGDVAAAADNQWDLVA